MSMIKPSHRGLLHKELGVAPGKKIPKAKIRADLAKAKRTGNVAEEKRDVFAENFGHPKSHDAFHKLGHPKGGKY